MINMFNEQHHDEGTTNVTPSPYTVLPPQMASVSGAAIVVGTNSDGGKDYYATIDLTVGAPWRYFHLIQTLNMATPEDTFLIDLYTGGGHVESGVMIAHAIHNSAATQIKTRNIGICASIGTVIYGAGKQKESTPRSTLMYHMPSVAGVAGKVADITTMLSGYGEYFAELLRIMAGDTLTEQNIEDIVKRNADVYIRAKHTKPAIGSDVQEVGGDHDE